MAHRPRETRKRRAIRDVGVHPFLWLVRAVRKASDLSHSGVASIPHMSRLIRAILGFEGFRVNPSKPKTLRIKP